MLLEVNLANFNTAVERLAIFVEDKFMGGEDKTFTQITQERSDLMHQAASKYESAEERGVWKIGNAHVMDIKSRSGGQINYNLVTQKDFNKYFLRRKNPSSLCTLLSGR